MKTSSINGLLFGCLIFTATALASCGIRGEGEVVSRTFDLETINGIISEVHADIQVTQDSLQKIEISAQENILDNLGLDVFEGMLTIDNKKAMFNYEPITVKISMRELRQLSIHGSGSILTTNTFDSCGSVALSISGSGSIKAGLREASTVTVNISGSGEIYLNGNARDQEIKVSGSGDIHAYAFRTQTTAVKISGSGDCEIQADSSLNVSVSGSGDVYFKGRPLVSSDISGSGAVHNAN